MEGSQIISPAIAGLVVQWFGTAASSVLSSMRQGFSFIFTHAAISFVILAMTAGMFAVRCFGALLSVYVRDVLLSNASLFGTLNSLIGIGMITGTQFLHRVASRVPQQFLVIYGLGGMGVAVLITSWPVRWRSSWVSAELYFGSAAMLGIVGAIGYAWLRKPKENPCFETSQPS